MRQFPREIEADLLFRGIDIGDWHRGKMSSRRLLCLIDALPEDDTAYWRERRDGDWSAREYINAAIVNELRLMRADQAAIHTDEKMDVSLVESPAQAKQDEEMSQRVKDVRAHLKAQLTGNKTE